MKMLGVLMVIAASTAIGVGMGESLKNRVQTLLEIQLFGKMLKSEIAYGGTPMAEAVYMIAETGENSIKKFLVEIVEELKKRDGRQPEYIITQAGKKLVHEKKLTEKDVKRLAKTVGRMGYSNRETQLKIIEIYLQQINYEIEQAQEKVHQNEKMYRFLGFMGGLLFAILLY